MKPAARFAEHGATFLFLILFVFTVAFPFVKINTMLVLWLWPRLEEEQTRQMYRFVSHMGKWSMLDVFVVALLVALVQLRGVATIHAGLGAVAFAAVVVLTMYAAQAFDPRLMWDRVPQ